MSGYRISPPRIFGNAARSPKPDQGTSSVDAFRQSGFLIGEEINSLLIGLNLESSIASIFSGAKYRNHTVASLLLNWSRSWLARLAALHALENGNYSATFPLIRASIDHVATQHGLLQSDLFEWNQWLETEGIYNDDQSHALSLGIGHFRPGEFIAAEPDLRLIYRIASDFTMPHFGTTLLVAGGESGPDRIAVTFADRDFNLAFAELTIGWLLEIGVFSFRLLHNFKDLLDHSDNGLVEKWIEEATVLKNDSQKCSLAYNQGSYLIENWRRTPTARPRKIIIRLQSDE
jgi:hypothetical protein